MVNLLKKRSIQWRKEVRYFEEKKSIRWRRDDLLVGEEMLHLLKTRQSLVG